MGLRLPGRPREGLRRPKLLPFFLNKHDVLCPRIFCPEPSYRYFPLITLRVVALVLNCCLKGDGNFPSSPPGWILALIVKVGADRQIGSMSLLPKGVLTKSKQPSLIPPPWTWLAATSPVSPHHQTMKWRTIYSCHVGTPEHFESMEHHRTVTITRHWSCDVLSMSHGYLCSITVWTAQFKEKNC